MIHIKEAIIVEGKYDKERLRQLTDAPILCTHGFSLYRSKALLNSIRYFAKTRGILILTDSDRAGFRIRNHIKTCVGKDCVIKNAYIPSISGKERRKEKPGKEGLLGVEGMTEDVLREILRTAATPIENTAEVKLVTKTNFFEDGLTGKSDSGQKRKALAKLLHLPPNISSNALLDFLNQTGGLSAYQNAIRELEKEN